VVAAEERHQVKKQSTPEILRTLLEAQQAQIDKTIRTLGVRPTAKMLDEARRRLRGDIQDIVRRGGSDTFSAAHKRQVLQHLEIGIADMSKRFRGILDPASTDIMRKSADHLEAELGVYAKATGRRPTPASGIDTATHFAQRQTLLRNLRTIDPDTTKAVQRTNARSVARYGEALIDDMERELTLGKITGASVDEMTDRILGVGDSVFNGARYRAERIVRTEMMNAYSTQRQESMEAVADEMPMSRMWVSVLEEGRTCERCDAMHGQIRGLDEPFRDPNGKLVPHPPRHPACMCSCIPYLATDKIPAFWREK
jgi:SPP1 gp7 family putative phage head morphogenesis protein